MLSLTFLLLYFFLFMGLSYSQLHMHTYYLPLYIYIYIYIFLGSLSIKRILLPPTPSYLTSSSWRYIPPFRMHFHCRVLPCVLLPFSSSFIIFFSCMLIYLFLTSAFFLSRFFFFYAFRLTLSPFSIYHPMSEEVSAAISTPMEGCFDGADIMSEAMATASTTTQGGLAETPIPSPKLGPVEESAQTERVGSASPTTPPIISTSDPFGALS